MVACIYAPGSWGDCLDLTCSRQGGRCQFVGGPGGRDSCRCVPALPSPNRALAGLADMEMQTVLENYRRFVAEQPVCDGVFFAEALGRARAGDVNAARDICGRCLRFALAAADERVKAAPSPPLFDVIEEANLALMEAITTYAGDDVQDFMTYARLRMEQRVAAVA
jgi:DNA-directed RNA polymerase sigma subunit (sigma70/sigma32)